MILALCVELLTAVLTDGPFHYKRDTCCIMGCDCFSSDELFCSQCMVRAQSLIQEEMRGSFKAKDEIKGTQSTLAGCVQNHNALWKYPVPRRESRCMLDEDVSTNVGIYEAFSFSL